MNSLVLASTLTKNSAPTRELVGSLFRGHKGEGFDVSRNCLPWLLGFRFWPNCVPDGAERSAASFEQPATVREQPTAASQRQTRDRETVPAPID
jgi:hypothetical protein